MLVPALFAGCVSYEPVLLDPVQLLLELESVEWSAPAEAPGSGSTPRQLAALAVSRHPELAAQRAELGVARARLIEAGLLPDPELGWDAMDVVAADLEGAGSGAQEVLSGLGLMVPLPRPGERDAHLGIAEARRTQALRRLLATEWQLTRDVYLACEEVGVARRLAEQTAELSELARSTDDFFGRARDAGAATAIQANLAAGQWHAIQLDALAAEARSERAQQALNSLLGLPPAFALAIAPGEDPVGRAELRRGAVEFTRDAVRNRPDLAQSVAAYDVAEQELRLAVARQYPLVAIGTGISITPGLFSRFGRPAIETARARREQLRMETAARVHELRAEIASAQIRWDAAQRDLELIESQLLPNAERTLELSRVAFEAGEMTLLESLALQRSLVEARTRHTEARGELAKSAWALLAAGGLLLAPDPSTPSIRGEASR